MSDCLIVLVVYIFGGCGRTLCEGNMSSARSKSARALLSSFCLSRKSTYCAGEIAKPRSQRGDGPSRVR
eukprot:6136558-Pyramimonas_sp.AAC.1